MSKRTKIIIGVVALLVVAGVAASFALNTGGRGPVIQTATVQQTDMGVTVSASGKIQAGARADVFPPAAGTLAAVYVSDGATVSAGDRLAKMDTGPLSLAVKQARSALAQAQAAYDNMDAQGVTPGDVSAARAAVDAAAAAYRSAKLAAGAVAGPTSGQLDAAQAAYDAADSAYGNASDAYDDALAVYGSMSPTTTAALTAKKQAYSGYLSAKQAYDALLATDMDAPKASADSGVAAAYSAYKAAQSALDKARAADPASSKASARSAVSAAAKALEVAEGNLDSAVLVAPIDGTVFFNALGAPGSDGQTPKAAESAAVTPGSAPFSVVDMGGVLFVAEVDEADIDRVGADMEAEVTLDSFPGETFKAKVTQIDKAAQPTATGGTIFPVKLTLDAVGKNILIGMKGDATVKVSSIPSALTIPLEALFNENGTNFVYKVQGGKLTKTTITIGAQTDTDVEVLEGLKKDDVVALASTTTYTDGMSVTVKN